RATTEGTTTSTVRRVALRGLAATSDTTDDYERLSPSTSDVIRWAIGGMTTKFTGIEVNRR
ncbi:hypothetical protein Dimus_022856, partial [Dionaea muscipula]